ncbi:MAG: type II secretion system major pseudopilin GspG [Deltaproteobacteria bacterium]|nr:type II secretion system major pseudopilin GspG [Deltaproteobacteria bacterium]
MRVSLRKPVHSGPSLVSGGFTLLEIMVVVIIIGTIAGLVGVKVLDRLEEAREHSAKAQMASIKSALDLFKMDNGFYPPSEIGIAALISGDRFGGKAYLNSDTVPMDPWNMPYGYVSDGTVYSVWSNGPDRAPQTPDDIQG